MPKRKSCNQSLKQRVKALEMRLGVSKLNSRLSLKIGRTGEIEGFGMAYGALAAGAIECEIAARAADDAELSKR